MELFHEDKEVRFEWELRTAQGALMTDPNPAREKDLLERIKAGDEEAFIQLYRERYPAVHRFALQVSGSPSLADDVTQEVFLALIREVSKYDPARGSLSAYLYGMARNMVIDHIKRRSLDVSISRSEEEEGAFSSTRLVAPGDPLGDLTRDEAVEGLRKAVLALPEHYREVVVLCDLHEMKYDHAAQILGLAVGTVRSRLYRARELLLKKMTARTEAGPEVANFKTARCSL
ncbi:MAG TPA: RNA polymerase sigma factor [Terriglobia bacterium]|nr:RNA polymerase sigma factor [Terriglobia bacterium]